MRQAHATCRSRAVREKGREAYAHVGARGEALLSSPPSDNGDHVFCYRRVCIPRFEFGEAKKLTAMHSIRPRVLLAT